MKLRIAFFLAAVAAMFNMAIAAPPPSWSVNPPSYLYSMTVTAIADINCIELTNPSNRIGAFVGGICRGTALTSNVINGKYIASMTVYSNVPDNEQITLRVYNATNDIIYEGVDTIMFQENATFGVSTSPFVVRNNNAPTAIQLSSTNVNEGMPIGTTVGNFTTTDVNAGQTHTYTLVSGTGSTNNNLFSILGGQLQTAVAFNFNTQNSYNIRVRSTDNLGCYTEQTYTITINDVNTTPTYIYISDSTVSENSSSLTVIGTFSALDNDLNETYTYALVSGVGSTDNASFNISGNALRTSLPFNYEVKSSYSIRVRVTDVANNIYERQMTILVDDANDAPTNILLNGNPAGVSFAENRSLGAFIATLSSTDEDINNSYIYTFVNTAGNNNSDFAIVGNQLRTNNLFDYETRQNYVIFVQTNDGNGGLFTKQFLVNVTDSNDAPTGLSISNTTITENLAANTFIGKFSNTDPDGTGTFTYTLVSGAGSGGNSNFIISNDSLYSAGAFDFETTSSYSIRANVSDGNGGNFQQQLTINVLNGNDAPTDITITSNQIAENLASNASVGQLTSNDQDITNTFTYTLVSGVGSTDNSSFNISGNNLRASVSFDYETKNTYSVRIRTTDNLGASFEKVFTVNVTDVVDAPTNILLSNDSLNENLAPNTLIGTLTSTNQNSGLTFTYAFDNNVTGNDNSSFIISGNELRSNASFDYETKNVYSLYITTTTGTTSFTKLMQVFVKNVNDAPTNITLSNNSINENKAAHTYIGRLTTSDPDNNTTYNYSLVNGVGALHNSSFSISTDSLFTASVFDFETQSQYAIRVETNDNLGGTFQKIFTVTVTNVNDTPTNITLSENTINENLPSNTSIGSFTSTDQDTNNTYFYTLASGTGSTDNGSFTIVGSTLRTTNTFNFETKSSYAIRIRTTDNNGLWFEKQFTISVNNLNDVPTDIALSNDTITENRAANTIIGLLTSTDEDIANSFTYSFANISGNSNSLFTLTNNQLRTAGAFNYEQQSSYYVYVQTNDGNGGTFVKQFQINVKDSNDAPTDISLSSPSINENRPTGTFIGTFSSSDPDQTNTFSYALVTGTGSTNNSSFYISNDSLYNSTVLNFETQSSFSIRVRTQDNGMLSYQKVFTIMVNDSNDLPTAISLTATSVNENMAIGTTVATLNTTDADAGQTFTYSLVSGIGSTNNNQFSIQGNLLKTNTIFNYETKNSYTIRVQTNDGNGGTFVDTFNIAILNANDAPTNINLSNSIIPENRAIGSLIGLLTTIDEDTNTFNYSFANLGTNDNSNFIISGNELKTNSAMNYESKQLYVVQLQTSDGNGGTFAKQFLINISDSNDAPTDIILDNNQVAENMPVRSFIGKLTTSDIDAGTSTFAYTMVSGIGSTHNASFIISNDSIFTNAVFNYEQQASFNIRVRTTDNGLLFTEKQFTIQLMDANDTPTVLTLNNNTVKENVSPRTRVGEFATTDADVSNTFTYTLVSGVGSTDNGAFIISGNQLQTNSALNYELKQTYQIRVRTTDNNGLWIENNFTVNVTDSNDAPTQITISTNNFTENKPFASLVASFTTTDQDTTDNFVYNFSNILGNDNASFFITNNQLRSAVTFDFETKRVYNVYVQSTDGLASITKQFVINITDSNDAPTNMMITSNTIAENALPNTLIGLLYTSDADAIETFSYSLVSGTGATNNTSFRIVNDSLYSNATFNFETKSQYSIRLRATDNGGLWYEKQMDIVVINTNDEPTDISLSSNEITENRANRTVIANLSTTDEDADAFTYNLVSGTGSTNNNLFVIQAGQLKSNGVFDYETATQYSIRVQTNDGNGGTFEKAFVINVMDTNDAPTNIVLSKSSIAENATIGSKVCDIQTIDQDVADNFVYTFADIAGNNNNLFFLVGNQLRTSAVFDYETKNYYLVYLQTTDASTASITRQFIINITDSADKPTALLLSNNTIAENKPVNQFIGMLNSTDADQFGNFNYQLVGGAGGTNNGSFTISNDSLLSNATFNFEAQKTYSIRLRTTDVTNEFFEQQFTINVVDENDGPTALQLSNNTLAENSALNAQIGLFSTSDVDAGDMHSYTLVSGTGSTDNAMFTIEDNKLLNLFSPDFETKNSYAIRVQSKDMFGDSVERSFTINITDKVEKPTIANQTYSVSENGLVNDVIGTVVATSPDAGANLKFVFAANNTFFSLNETSGQITLSSAVDYEKQKQYVLAVIVKDDQPTPTFDTATVTINIVDEIETKQNLPANNYMSPNGDGLNDFFTIENVALYADYSLTVYNEGGMEVFKVLNNYNNNWDGTFSGKQLPTGVYFYVFYNSKTGAEFKGALNIIKQ